MANIILLCSDSLLPYKIVKVIKPFKKLPRRILGDFYDSYYYCYCYYYSVLLLVVAVVVVLPST